MRKRMVEKDNKALSIRRQCELLGINRNRLEGAEKASGVAEEDLELAREIDKLHLRFPEFGSRRTLPRAKSLHPNLNSSFSGSAFRATSVCIQKGIAFPPTMRLHLHLGNATLEEIEARYTEPVPYAENATAFQEKPTKHFQSTAQVLRSLKS